MRERRGEDCKSGGGKVHSTKPTITDVKETILLIFYGLFTVIANRRIKKKWHEGTVISIIHGFPLGITLGSIIRGVSVQIL